MTLLGLDTETTGLHPESNILTLNLSIVKEYKILDSIDLFVKPDPDNNGRSSYNVQAEALGVNGINLVEHDKIATPYKPARKLVYNWLQSMHTKYGYMVPFGNMVQQDVTKITDCLISKDSWGNFVDRRVIELSSIGQNLKLLGKIPEEQSLSLSRIAAYFGIEFDESKVHGADYDVWLGTEVLRCYNEL